MPRPAATSPRSVTTTLAAIVVVLAALYFAQEVLVPLALALLLSFLLAPLVLGLQRLGLWRIPSVLLVVLLAFALMAGIGWIVAGQLVDLADRLPEYQHNVQAKVNAIQGMASRVFGRAGQAVQEVTQEARATADLTKPLPVRVIEPPSSPLLVIQSVIGPLVHPLATAGIVIVFVIFMLIQRESLRDRLLRLAGAERLNLTTEALDDAGHRVSRYLLTQALINSSVGIVLGVAFYFIGVPNALLWGLLAGLLRFVPFVGPIIAAIMPITLSLATSADWLQPILTLGIYLAVELLAAYVFEPWLYGAGTGISALAVLVAAVFWTWMWGPIGLLLSTPLTVCLIVLGRYVPQLAFLNVLLGDEEEVLPPEAHLYQRLLAQDLDEATQAVEEHLEQRSVSELYDQIFLPALILAEQDRHRGKLSAERQQSVHQGIRALIEQVRQQASPVEGAAPSTALVLCLPARDQADELAALMLQHLLELHKLNAATVSVEMLGSEMLDQAAHQRPDLVCISALPPGAIVHTRYLSKRLRVRFPQLKQIVGLWTRGDPANAARNRLQLSPNDKLATTLSQALQHSLELVQPLLATPPHQPLHPPDVYPARPETTPAAPPGEPRPAPTPTRT